MGAAALKLLGTAMGRDEKREKGRRRNHTWRETRESSTLFLHTTAKSIKVVVVCVHISHVYVNYDSSQRTESPSGLK